MTKTNISLFFLYIVLFYNSNNRYLAIKSEIYCTFVVLLRGILYLCGEK